MKSISLSRNVNVESIQGNGVLLVNGTPMTVTEGTSFPSGTELVLPDNSEAVIVLSDGTLLAVEAQGEQPGAVLDGLPQDVQDEIAEIQQQILDGEGEITIEDDQATAAGGDAAAGSGSWSYVNVARDGSETIASSGFDTDSLATNNGAIGSDAEGGAGLAIDTTAPGIPGVTIVNDANNDGIISGQELGDGIQVLIDLSDTGANPGDVLTINGQTSTITEQNIIDGTVTITLPDTPADGETLTVEATITDTSGNTSAPGSDQAEVDTSAEAGTVSVNNITSDDVINAQEAGETITVTGSASGGDIAEGDTVAMTINGEDYTTTVDENGEWSVDVAGSDLAADTEFEVVVSSSDDAGNTVDSTATSTHTVDQTADAGTVSVNNITSDDVINAQEAGETITVTGSASGGDIAEGDTVAMTINGEDYTTTVDENGEWSVDVAGSDLAADTEFEVVVSSSDDAGNTVDSTATSTHTVDQTADAGTVSVNNITSDDVINAQEAGETITVTGSASGGDIAEGDTVAMTINGEDYTTTVDENGEWSVDVAGSDLAADTEFEVVVSSSDDAGNTVDSIGSSAHTVDTTIATPSITLEAADANNDGIYNAEELGEDGTVTASISLPDDFDATKDTLTINGETHTLTAEERTAGEVNVEVAPEETITAQITDAAGNVSEEASATALESDTEVQAPTISIAGDTNEDGVYNAEELGEDGTVTASISLPDDFDATKDTLTINGETHTLTAEERTAGEVNVEVAPEETITAQITDAAGNVSEEASATALESDTEVQAPTISIAGDTNEDGVYNAEELGEDGTVTASISLPDDFDATKDTLTINGETHTLTAEERTAGEVNVEVAPEETITAQITDAAGNVSEEASATALESDTEVQAPTISIAGDTNEDGVYNAEELGEDGTVTASISLPDDFDATKDTLTINGETHTLTAEERTAGEVNVEVAPEETITAQITDAAGNVSEEASATALESDTEVQAPTISIAGDTNEDGVYNAEELGEDGTVTASISLPDDFDATKDTLTINGETHTLTAEERTAGEVNVEVAPEETITAQITDAAGNVSEEASATALESDTEVQAPTISIAGDTNEDGVYNAEELGEDGTVTASISLPDDFDATKDTLTINGETHTLTAEERTAGEVNVEVAPEETITAQITDAAGNVSEEASATALESDTEVQAPTISIAGDTNEDGVYNAEELGEDGTVTASISLPDDFDATKDTLTINGETHTLTAEERTAGEVNVEVAPEETITAQITDAAGNVSEEASATALESDTEVQAPTISIAGDTNEDGVYNAEELGEDGTVTASISLPDDFDATKDTLTINGETHTLTAEERTAGEVNVEVAPEETITAQITDAAGNVSEEASATALESDTEVQAPTISIAGDTNEDGVYNAEELGEDGTVTASISLPDDFDATKDTLTINGETHTLTAEERTAGEVNVEVAPEETITAQITDAAGNVSEEASATALESDTEVQAPTISIAGDTNEDGVYNAEELGEDGTVTASISLPDDFDATKDTLTINGETHTLTAEERTAGEVNVEVAPEETITAQITDAAGNVSEEASATALESDTEVQAPTISIAGDTNEDGVYNAEELGEDGTVTASISLPDDFDATKDTLTINGETHTLTAEERTAGEVNVEVAPEETITAQITDAAGNVSEEASATALESDTEVQAPTISIAGDTNEDGVYNAEELGEDGTVTASISLPDDFDATKDTLTINGETHTLTAEERTAGEVNVEVAPEETITAQITDAAGNVSEEASATALESDTEVQAPTISIAGDTNEDGVYNAEELGEDGTVTASISLPDDFDATKDTLTINGETHTLTAEERTAGEVNVEVAPEETITAQITDAAGNVSEEASATALESDTEVQAPTISIAGDTNEDGVYNAEELGEDGTVTASISLPDDFDATKDTLTINGETHTLTAEERTAGEVNVEVAPEETITAQITDAAGNVSEEASATALESDTEVQAPTISIAGDTNEDGVYNAEELGEDGTVTASISLPDDFDATKDTLTINGETHTLTAEERTAGEVNVEVAPEETITAQITDAAGNVSEEASATALESDTEVQAPTISIAGDTNEDGVYNAEELGEDGTVTASISLPDDFDATKDTLTINGETHTLTAEERTAGEVNVEVAPEETITAQITDAAGNVSEEASATALESDTEVQAPTISIAGDTNEDGVYNAEELGEDGTVTASISLPDDFDATKDTLTINGETHTLTAEERTAGEVNVEVAPEETITAQITDATINGETHTLTAEERTAGEVNVEVAPEETITAQITDAAGNVSEEASATALESDTEVQAPTISIAGDTNEDGVYNAEELGEDGTVTASISLPDDFDATKDTLTINGETHTLTAEERTAGEVNVEVAPEETITAQITDAAGNVSEEASATALESDTEVQAPTISIAGDTNEDGVYNAEELGEDGTVTASISLPDDFDATKDTLTINGETHTLTAEERTAGEVNVEVAPEETITAQITDAAGNVSEEASATALESDTEVQAPTISIAGDTNEDGVYNAEELGEDGTVTASISLPDDFDATKDTLTINGETHTLTAEERTAGEVNVEVAPEETITAQITDAAGNVSEEASATALESDTEVQAPTISIAGDTNEDGVYNAEELGEDGTVTASISLPDDFDATKDTLTINGETHTLTAEERTAGEVNVEVAPEETITAQITDAAGNVSEEASATALESDTEVQAPTISIAGDTNEDGVYNAEELGEDGTVTASISLPDDFDATKDTLTINGETHTLTAEERTAGEVNVEVAPEETITAQITDAAGNVSEEASATALESDTEVQAPTISIAGDTNEDGVYNAEELGEDGTVTASISLPDDFDATKDTLTINGETHTLTAEERTAGEVNVEVAPEETITAQITDAAGNVSEEASATALESDTEVQAPTISIAGDTNEDGVYNAEELGEDGTVTASISLPDDFDATKDTLTINGETHTLTAEERTAGEVNVEVAPEETITAQITDAAGNVSEEASATALESDTEVQAPTISIAGDTNEDGVYNAEELGEDGTVTASISLPDDFDATKDTLTINGETHTLTAEERTAGEVNVEVAPEETITAQITDAAGNVSEEASATALESDTEVQAPTISIAGDTNEDGVYNAEELGEDGTVTASISLPDDFDATKDTLTINGETHTLTAEERTAGEVNVEVAPEETITAQITDAAGNVSEEASATALESDTEVQAPTISIAGDTNEDGVYNAEELGEDGTVTASISLPDDFDATKDTLTINGETHTLTAEERTAGEVNVEVAPEETITAQITDAAGNVSEEASATALESDTEVQAPTISIAGDTNEDGVYNAEELGEDGTVTASISLPDDFDATKDTLTINGETHTLTAEERTAGEVNVEVAPEETITAQITDAAGNVSEEASATALESDTEVQAPTISIAGDTNEDGVYNAEELGEDGTVTASISLPDDFDATKDTLTINGETHTLTAEERTAGEVNVEVAPEETITAQITDAAGNVSEEASATALESDTEVQAPTISIAGDTNEDGVYNAEELGEDGTVTASISLPDDFDATKDTLTINGETHTLTAEERTAGEVNVEVAPEETITAQITDAAGNVSEEASATALESDTEVQAPTISIAGDTNEDGVYNAEELGEDGTVTASISLPDDFDATKDTLTINGETHTLTAEERTAGEVNVEVAPEETITAQITDAAGNVSEEASATALESDTEVQAPTISIAGDTNEDGVYNAEELGEDGTVTASISLPDDFDATKDTLTINGETHTLTAEERTAGEVNVEVAPEETITAQITDAAGNVSEEASATALESDTEVQAPTISIAGDTNEDGVYNAEELGEDGTVTASISLPDDFDATKDTLTINGETHTLTAEERTAGEVNVEVAPEETITAQITDAAGNVSEEASATALESDTEVQAPTIKAIWGNDSNTGLKVEAEPNTELSFKDQNGDAIRDKDGDILKVSVDESGQVTLNGDNLPDGEVLPLDIVVVSTDSAGNSAEATAPAQPTLTIEDTGSSDHDRITNQGEVTVKRH
ncbi:Ig-like domain-containing protein [Salinivibrio costicola]|uniref:Ig-like domain-containing protein n=1 Tax=Salinivibrio costicola TaxID=51367 RepID=UPI003F6FCD65